MTIDLCGYVSQVPAETLLAHGEIEQTRRALMRGEATAKTLAYARFLTAVENDATMSHGVFKKFAATDDEVVREWPLLAAMVSGSNQ